MLVIFNGEKKDLTPIVASRLIKRGLATLVTEEEVIKKTRKKIVKDE